MTNIFETKEQYLEFRNFWKTFHKDGGHKAKKVDQTTYNYLTGKNVVTGYRLESDLKGGHHMVYLAILGKNFDKGFGNATYSTLETLRVAFKHSPHRFTEFFDGYLTEEQKTVAVDRINTYLIEKVKS